MCSLWGMGSGGSESKMIELNLEGWMGSCHRVRKKGHCGQRDQLGQRQRSWAPLSQSLFTMSNYNYTDS